MDIIMMPKYVNLSSHEKDGFLSQHGNFTSAERTVFQKLCSIWEEKIPYESAISKISSQSVNSTAALQALMKKFQSFGLGLIRTKLDGGNAVPSHIIFTEEHSKEFFYELIEEFITQALLSPSFPLPLSTELQNRRVHIPSSGVLTADFGQLISSPESNDKIVLKIPLDNQMSMFCTKNSVSSLVDATILKLRYFLKDPLLQKKLQQLLKISPIELQKQLKSLDITHWLNITRTIAKKKQEMFDSLERGSEWETYYYSCFLSQYLSKKQSDAERLRQKEEKKQENFMQLLSELKNNKSLITNKTEFDRIIEQYSDEYGEDLQDFYQEFINEYIKPFAAGMFPPVLTIDKGFIHQDNIFRYFYEQFLHLHQEATTFCQKEMQNAILSSTPTGFFLTSATLEAALRKFVREENSFVAVILDKPAFFAEAIIHHAQNANGKRNIKNAEKLLAQFFRVQNMELKQYSEILSIDATKIFHRAFSTLPFFTRLWWRITGKMLALEEKFNTSFKRTEVEDPESEFASADLIQPPRRTRKQLSAPKSPSSTSTRISDDKSQKITDTKDSRYSSDQLEKVWQNFQKSIGKD